MEVAVAVAVAVLVDNEVVSGYRVEVTCSIDEVSVEAGLSAAIVFVVGINVDVLSSTVTAGVKIEVENVLTTYVEAVVILVLVKMSLVWKLAMLTGGGVESEMESYSLETAEKDDTCSKVDVGVTID